MWSASKLSRNCAHHHILSDLTPKKSRDVAAAKGKDFHSALEAWHKNGLIPPAADDEVNGWLQTMVGNGWSFPDGCELEVAWGLDTFGAFCPVEETEPHVYRSITGDDLLTAGRADLCYVTDGI